MFSITQVRVLALRLTVFGKGGGRGSASENCIRQKRNFSAEINLFSAEAKLYSAEVNMYSAKVNLYSAKVFSTKTKGSRLKFVDKLSKQSDLG